MALTIYQRNLQANPELVPQFVTIDPLRAIWQKWQNSGGYVAYLDWRGPGQMLPRGSSPLLAFGGRVIPGQEWSVQDVEAFILLTGLNPDEVCIFEYTRGT